MADLQPNFATEKYSLQDNGLPMSRDRTLQIRGLDVANVQDAEGDTVLERIENAVDYVLAGGSASVALYFLSGIYDIGK